MRCFQQNFITPFIYSKIGSTSSGATLAAAVPALPELRNPQSAVAASEQAVNAAPDLPVPLFSRPVPGCAAVPWILALIWAHNSDLTVISVSLHPTSPDKTNIHRLNNSTLFKLIISFQVHMLFSSHQHGLQLYLQHQFHRHRPSLLRKPCLLSIYIY